MKHYLLATITFFGTLTTVFGQNSASGDRLKDWTLKNPAEKIYLHLDRPYYFRGDSIWFKAYVVTGENNRLSRISGALYAELIGTKGILINLKLPVVNGLAKGCFPLGRDIPRGIYRVRAYTNWMNNSGANSFFDRAVTVSEPGRGKLSATVVSLVKKSKRESEAVIRYENNDGVPVRSSKIGLDILSLNNSIKKGEATTDPDGNIKVDFSVDPKGDPGYVQVLGQLASDTSLNSRIVINTSGPGNDVQFLPEGGTMVEGMRSRIAVKSIGPDGLGKDASGSISDEAGNKVTDFQTDFLGMGKFSLTPEPGRSYHATVNGQNVNIPIGKASDSGAGLAIYNNDPDTMIIRISAGVKLYTNPVTFRLIGMAANEIVFQADVTIDKPMTSLNLPDKLLPSGVIQFTLLSDLNKPVAERLVFNDLGRVLALNLKADQKDFLPRRKVGLGLSATGLSGATVSGSFSVSVVNESVVPSNEDDEHTILTDLLICSDIKGYIERPGYYFNHTDSKKRAQLDLLMLTQGYRHYEWKSGLIGQSDEPLVKAESMSTGFTGTITTLGGKPVDKAKVTMLSIKSKIFEQAVSDAAGKFSFPNFVLADSVKLSFKAVTAQGRRADIKLDSLPGIQANIADGMMYWTGGRSERETILIAEKAKTEQRKKYKFGDPVELNEVNIKDRKKGAVIESSNLNGQEHADFVLHGSELGTCPTLRQCLEGRVPGLSFNTVDTKMGPVSAPFLSRYVSGGNYMLLYWNGLKIDIEDYPNYFEQNIESPSDITYIEVLKTTSYTNIYGAQDRGVLVITTKSGFNPSARLVPGYALLRPKGFNQVKEFYVPQYAAGQNRILPDYRNTIYWNPGITTNDQGQATFSFFNSDAKGIFRVTVEGITPDGVPGRAVWKYEVK